MSNLSRAPLWLIALLVAIGLHVGLFLVARLSPQPLPAQASMPAMMIELAPLPAAPAAAPAPPAPEPEPVKTRPVELPKPKIELPKPPPKPPKPPKPRPPKEPPPKPLEKPAEQPAATPAQETVAADSTSSSPASSPQTGQPASAPSQAQINWQSILRSHLMRYQRYPAAARRRGEEGVNSLRFTVDGRGKVISFELVRSSGSAALDRATLDMIRRAQPLPTPPPDILRDGRLEIVAPFAYSLKRR